jgi:UDP-N-acetyl-D-galactosamine dehydrogenase
MLGITFKENCPDIRNTKAIDVYRALKAFHMDVDVYDPWASKEEVIHEYGIETIAEIKETYDAIIHVVSHNEFQVLDLETIKNDNGVIYDVKGNLTSKLVNKRL